MRHQNPLFGRRKAITAKALMVLAVISAVILVLVASQASTLSKPSGGHLSSIGTLAEKLYWSKAVINVTVNTTTAEVSRGSSFSVLVTLTYLEGRFADGSPITLLLDAHKSQEMAAVTFNASGIIRQVSLNDLVTWDVGTRTLTPNASVSATMTFHVPSVFPITTIFLTPLFGFTPSQQVTTNTQATAMIVN